MRPETNRYESLCMGCRYGSMVTGNIAIINQCIRDGDGDGDGDGDAVSHSGSGFVQEFANLCTAEAHDTPCLPKSHGRWIEGVATLGKLDDDPYKWMNPFEYEKKYFTHPNTCTQEKKICGHYLSARLISKGNNQSEPWWRW